MNYPKLFVILSIIYGAVLFSIIYSLHQGVDEEENASLDSSTAPPPISQKAKPEKDWPFKPEDAYQFRVNKPSSTELTYYTNPFAVLGAYPDPTAYVNGPDYDKPSLGMINDDNYCDKVDMFNLENPENMFEKMKFYTDFFPTSVMKTKVMNKLGTIYMPNVHRNMATKTKNSRTYRIDGNITLFHVTADMFYRYHEIGKHFLCATQMFSHIPNHTNIVQKDHFPESLMEYTQKYNDKPECFNKNMLVPATYRLSLKDECQEFFDIINSEKYINSLKTEPIQYLIKIGHSAHKAQGVFLLDKNETEKMNSDFDYGKKCGEFDNILVAQKYITNPMLLDNNNKFHLRVYVLIASTNPLIAFYHDGYLRASIFPFDKFSEDRATHLTNLLMGDNVAGALTNNSNLSAKAAKQLEDYYLWSFEELENYLIESGKTKDFNWLDNQLRPALQKAFVHVVKMTGDYLWKQSNVYEMLGCDFMLDDQMNVWFIEANANPLLDGVQTTMITQMLKDLFEIQYAYYRSRMKRVLEVIQKMQAENEEGTVKNVEKWRVLYQEAVKNRLEPQYTIKETNSFTKIIDENLPGAKAYFGHIPESCVDK